MTSLEQTEQFMRTAGQVIPAVPTLPSPGIANLRVGLIQEELNELQAAFVKGDLVEVLDALADLRVVCDGTVLACGLKDVFPAALDEVHRSNMSKFPTKLREMVDTIYLYKQAGTEAESHRVTEGPLQRITHWVVRRKSDGKVLKSINYSPANLAPLLS